MFQSHKSFPFFYRKKGRKKITVSLTHKIFCNKHWFAPELLNMNFLLALCLLRAPRSPCGSPHRVQRFGKETALWGSVNIHNKIDAIPCTLQWCQFCSLLHLLYSHGINLIHEDIQQISNLYLCFFLFSHSITQYVYTFFKIQIYGCICEH